MSTRLLLMLMTGCLVHSPTPGHSADGAAPLDVVLRSAKNEYLVGEPVLLDLTVKNMGTQPVPVWTDHLSHNNIAVYVGSKGEPLHRWEPGAQKISRFLGPLPPLLPGESKTYCFHVVQTGYRPDTAEHQPGLAFPKPGIHAARARYPIYGSDPSVFASNTVEFRVVEPQGAEAKVWQQINRGEILQFLQLGEIEQADLEVPGKALEVFRTAPESRYRPAIRWALEQYYRRPPRIAGKPKAEREAELEEIREALGIPKYAAGPFPDDKRLDVRITYHFPQSTPLEEVFHVISARGGVPLRLAPELKRLSMTSLQLTETLRDFMRHRTAYKAAWVRDGEGYMLVPAANGKPKTP